MANATIAATPAVQKLSSLSIDEKKLQEELSNLAKKHKDQPYDLSKLSIDTLGRIYVQQEANGKITQKLVGSAYSQMGRNSRVVNTPELLKHFNKIATKQQEANHRAQEIEANTRPYLVAAAKRESSTETTTGKTTTATGDSFFAGVVNSFKITRLTQAQKDAEVARETALTEKEAASSRQNIVNFQKNTEIKIARHDETITVNNNFPGKVSVSQSTKDGFDLKFQSGTQTHTLTYPLNGPAKVVINGSTKNPEIIEIGNLKSITVTAKANNASSRLIYDKKAKEKGQVLIINDVKARETAQSGFFDISWGSSNQKQTKDVVPQPAPIPMPIPTVGAPLTPPTPVVPPAAIPTVPVAAAPAPNPPSPAELKAQVATDKKIKQLDDAELKQVQKVDKLKLELDRAEATAINPRITNVKVKNGIAADIAKLKKKLTAEEAALKTLQEANTKQKNKILGNTAAPKS